MKKKSSMKNCLKSKKAILAFLLSVVMLSSKAQSPCDTIVVTPPTIDKRGDTNLCSGTRLELCPLVWGYSNYQWYKDGTPYSTSSCIDITSAGTYTLSAQNGFGCWSAQSTGIIATGNGNAPSIPFISTGDTTTFCQGGSALLQSNATTGNQWYKDGLPISGATSQTYQATQTGNYSVTVTSCGGSSSSIFDVHITVNSGVTVTAITGTTSSCVGSTSQLVDTTLGGVWSSSDTNVAKVNSSGLVTAIANGSAVISYTVTNGVCSSSATVTFSVSSVATPVINVTGGTVICGTPNIQLCPTTWGASNYQWYKDGIAFSTSSCINPTTVGVYTLEASNHICTSSISNGVAITTNAAPTAPTVSAGGATTFCVGGSVTLSSTVAANYQWYKDSVIIGGATSQTYNATASGVYTVVVSGCGSTSSTNSITVTVNSGVTVTPITGTTSSCVGSTSQLVDTTLGGVWSSSDTTIAKVDTNGLVTAIANGSAVISYTVTNGVCSSSATVTFSVSSVATPVINVTGGTVICGTPNIQLCPTTWGASNYQWYKDGIAFSTSSCINPTTVGVYTLEASNHICTSSISNGVTITTNAAPTAPTVSAGGATTFCVGGSVTLSSTVAANYQWYKDSVMIGGATSQTYNATASGVYTVVVSGCGSTSSTNSITVTVNPLPTLANVSGVSTICLGNASTFTNATAGGTWSSSNPAVATVNPTTGVVTSVSAGTTIISYTVSNGICSNTASNQLTVFTSANVPVIDNRGATTFCQGGSLMMCPLVWGYSNYQWYKDGILISTASCITVNSSGSYTLAGQNGAGCWSSQSLATVVTVNPLPTVLATTGATSVCPGSTVSLSNSSTTPMGGSAIWISQNVRASVNSTSGVVTGNTSGIAVIRYQVTTALGCSAFVDYNVTVNSAPNTPNISFVSGQNPFLGAPSGSWCRNRIFTLGGSPSGGLFSGTLLTINPTTGLVNTGATTGPASVSYTVTNASLCSATRTFNFNIAACTPRGNVNLQSTSNTQFTIYPNPAKDVINIKFDKLSAGTIVVTDLYGKQLSSQPINLFNNTIDISRFSKGMYFVNIITESGREVRKVVVE